MGVGVLVFGLIFYYFYKVSYQDYPTGITDNMAHIIVSKNILNLSEIDIGYAHIYCYPLFHIINFVVGTIIGDFAVSTALILTASIGASFYMSLKIFKSVSSKSGIFECFVMIFIVALPLLGLFYLPQGSPTIWHNPTYIFAKPLALASFYYFYQCLDGYHKANEKIANYAMFGLASLLCCLAKPSFIIVFLPVAGCFTIITFIKTRLKSVVFSFKMLCAVMPTIVVLLFQYLGAFSSDLGIGLTFGTFLHISGRVTLLIIISVFVLPSLHVVTNRKTNSDHIKLILSLSWACALFGFVQFFFLETPGVASGDFGWGYYTAIYILYLVTISVASTMNDVKSKRLIYSLFIIQGLLGLAYFMAQLMLRGYYI